MSNETNFPIPPQPTVELHKLPPFPRFCCSIGMIPSSYKASMSYEEQLMWLCKYLEETVIPTINENTDATNSVILKYNEIVDFLNHYFDNLDVQQEINNKLDEMAENGYFDEILQKYINKSFIQYFDTVEDLKNADLSNGQIAGTKGYFSINDGGDSIYLISNNAPNVGYYIQLNNNLYAIYLNTKNQVNSICFGDTLSSSNVDDKNLIQNLINFSSLYKIKIKLLEKIYNVSGNIKVLSNTNLDLNNATIKLIDNSETCFFVNMDNYNNLSYELENISFINGTIDGNSDNNHSANLSGMFLILYYAKNIILKNLIIKDCERNAINFFEVSNVTIDNITFDGFGTQPSQYIGGGNYAINMENRISKNYIAKFCNISNIKFINSASHFIHVYNYEYCNLKNYYSENSQQNENLNSVVFTFTNAKHCLFQNIKVDNAFLNIAEVNQNSENITFDNMVASSSNNGIVFGNNGVTDAINNNIYIKNSYINCENYAMTYNHSNNAYFSNCKMVGGLGGGDTNASNIFFNNCTFNLPDTTKLYVERVATFIDCILNDYTIKNFSKNGFMDFQINFTMDSASETDINIILLRRLSSFAKSLYLNILAYNPASPNSKYNALYNYLISSITSDNGTLSEAIFENGSNYRKITPSITTRNQIHLATSSDTNLKGYLHFHN